MNEDKYCTFRARRLWSNPSRWNCLASTEVCVTVSWLGWHRRPTKRTEHRFSFSEKEFWRTAFKIGRFSVAAALLAASAIGAEPSEIRSYSTSANGNSQEIRTAQRFSSDIATFIETRIYSNYSFIVWRVSESVDEGNVRSFGVDGSRGLLFSVDDPGEYWGYYSDPLRLNIFVLKDDFESLKFEQYPKSDFPFKALMVQDGKIRAYECSFDIMPFKKNGYIEINNSKYRWYLGISNEKILAEVPIFLSKSGVDLVRDRCEKKSVYLSEAALRYNEDDDVRPDK